MTSSTLDLLRCLARVLRAAAAIYAHLGPSTLRAAADRTPGLRSVSFGPGRSVKKRAKPTKQAVGQPGLEPGTDGLKGPSYCNCEAFPADSSPSPVPLRAETLAARALVAIARGDASAERLTVEALEAVLAVAVPDEETG